MMDGEAVRLRNLLGFVERGPLMDAKDEPQTSDLGTDSHTHTETLGYVWVYADVLFSCDVADVAESKEKKSEVKVGAAAQRVRSVNSNVGRFEMGRVDNKEDGF